MPKGTELICSLRKCSRTNERNLHRQGFKNVGGISANDAAASPSKFFLCKNG